MAIRKNWAGSVELAHDSLSMAPNGVDRCGLQSGLPLDLAGRLQSALSDETSAVMWGCEPTASDHALARHQAHGTKRARGQQHD